MCVGRGGLPRGGGVHNVGEWLRAWLHAQCPDAASPRPVPVLVCCGLLVLILAGSASLLKQGTAIVGLGVARAIGPDAVRAAAAAHLGGWATRVCCVCGLLRATTGKAGGTGDVSLVTRCAT